MSPSEVHEGFSNLVCVVIDVLRASTTMTTLLRKGCPRVYTTETAEEARALAREHDLFLVGERGGLPIEGFHYSNSPTGLRDFAPKGRGAVLTTSNGTKAVELVSKAPAVLVGCFLNAQAACTQAVELAKTLESGIGFVCAGVKGRFVLDDAVCAGRLVKSLLTLVDKAALTDGALAALRLNERYPQPLKAFEESLSGRHLIDIGYGQDLAVCSQVDATDVVPLLTNTRPCSFTRA